MTGTGVALVTGAGRGLGRASALALSHRGYRIVVAARRMRAAETVANEIEEDGGKALPLEVDLASPTSITSACTQLLASIEETWGCSTIDALVNNAGIGVFAPLESVSADQFDQVFATNVRGPLLLVQALAPHLADGARIVNVSSSLSRHASPGTMVYSASKAAIESLTRTLALELGPRGIRVNSIAPGPTATDFNGGAMRDDHELRQLLGQQTALGRVGDPAEIGDAVAGLVSADLRWVTGQRIEASGGMLL